jgi:hypothetical protein
MADALYGQVVARHNGLPFFAPQEQLAAHLNAEMAHNFDAHGFRVITGRVTPPPGGQHPDDDTLWMQAGPDWSALALQLDPGVSPAGANVTAALDPARRQLENWRSRLRSLWNIAGLTTLSSNVSDSDPTDVSAFPYITSHYAFEMVDFYLLSALSGQQTNLPAGTLSFAPRLACPLQLPMHAAALSGTIACDAAGTWTLAVAFGALQLPAGGLSAGGRAYAGAVDLGPGGSVSW